MQPFVKAAKRQISNWIFSDFYGTMAVKKYGMAERGDAP
jgi:hypothetical protein